jgi:hypothetical protein
MKLDGRKSNSFHCAEKSVSRLCEGGGSERTEGGVVAMKIEGAQQRCYKKLHIGSAIISLS